MAFFNELSKKITDAGQGVAQQTKNFADVTRLNTSISDKKKRIAQLYSTMGQNYYEMHKADSGAELTEQIGEINGLFSEIRQIEEQIKQIKGVIKCHVCGAEMPLDAAFCNSCGAPVLKETPDETLNRTDAAVCPNCHAPIVPGNAFCNQCGAKLNQEEA